MEDVMMKAKRWDGVLLLGALCFLADAALLFLGYLNTPAQYSLSVLGLILIGAGAFGKKRAA